MQVVLRRRWDLNIAPDQIDLRPGDVVDYERPSGHDPPVTRHVLLSRPARPGGQVWVVWLEGVRGCVGLERVRRAEASNG